MRGISLLWLRRRIAEPSARASRRAFVGSMRLDQHHDVGRSEVERERRDVVRHGVVARRRAVPALPVADLRDPGLHRAYEVGEVTAR
jgi:hypothetical protein